MVNFSFDPDRAIRYLRLPIMEVELRDKDLDDFTDSLESDRFIEIFVGKWGTMFKVAQSILTSISEYFVKAIEHEHLGDGRPGIMTLSEDDADAWKILLHWKLKGTIPPRDFVDDHGQVLLVRCWCLGDKYDITEFQDLAMLELIKVLNGVETTLDIVKIAFDNSAPGSKLRKLMAEETVYLLKLSGKWHHERIDKLDGVVGFTSALLCAMDTCKASDELPSCSEVWDR